jgi:hypothetical protein
VSSAARASPGGHGHGRTDVPARSHPNQFDFAAGWGGCGSQGRTVVKATVVAHQFSRFPPLGSSPMSERTRAINRLRVPDGGSPRTPPCRERVLEGPLLNQRGVERGIAGDQDEPVVELGDPSRAPGMRAGTGWPSIAHASPPRNPHPTAGEEVRGYSVKLRAVDQGRRPLLALFRTRMRMVGWCHLPSRDS